MRNYFNFVFITFFTAFFLSGCGPTKELTQTEAESPEGKERAYTVSVEDADVKLARDVWSKFIRDNKGRLQKIKGSNIEIAPSLNIPGVSEGVTVKSGFRNAGKNTELQLWFVKDDRYLTPETDQLTFDGIDHFIERYFTEVESAQVKNEVDEEKKKLKQLEKDLSRLERQNEQLHKDISKAEDKIRDSRIKIEDNLKEQDQVNRQIDEQKRVINQTKDKLP